MNLEYLTTVLLKPVFTERSSMIENKYVFEILPSAKKICVKQAVEKLYGVTVKKVNVMNYKPVKKFFGRRRGSIKAFKKAYVTIEKGQSINLAEK